MSVTRKAQCVVEAVPLAKSAETNEVTGVATCSHQQCESSRCELLTFWCLVVST